MAIENTSVPEASTPALLLEAATAAATGALELEHPGGESSRLWLREGQLYAASVPGYRPALGIRLLSSGLINPEQLGIAIEQQRTTMAGHRIGEVLVRLGHVRPDDIDAFVLDQVHDQVADLLNLPVLSAAFHEGERIGVDTIAPRSIEAVLPVAEERRHRWARVLADVGGPAVIPALGPQGRGAGQSPLGPREWALLCRVDGRRDLAELARACGFTILEAAQLVSDLARSGLLVLPAPVRVGPPGADVIALIPADGSALETPGPPRPPGPAPAAVAEPSTPGVLLEAIHEFVTDASTALAPSEQPDDDPAVAGDDSDEPAAAYSDTSMFMRELSSLSEDQQQVTPSVTRRAIALDGPRRRRWRWGL